MASRVSLIVVLKEDVQHDKPALLQRVVEEISEVACVDLVTFADFQTTPVDQTSINHKQQALAEKQCMDGWLETQKICVAGIESSDTSKGITEKLRAQLETKTTQEKKSGNQSRAQGTKDHPASNKRKRPNQG